MTGLLDVILRGSLTCRASVTGSPDATCHTGAAWVSETQNQTEQMGSPVSRFNMRGYSDLTLRGQGWHTADRLGRWWDYVLNGGLKYKQSWLINRQLGKGGEECRPFTYSYSKTEKQLHPPARSVLSVAHLPFDGESSNVLQYGKGQESQGEALGSPLAKER